MYCFGSTYTKIGTIQRRLAWPLRKDDTQNREAFHIFCDRCNPFYNFHFCHFQLKLEVQSQFSIFRCIVGSFLTNVLPSERAGFESRRLPFFIFIFSKKFVVTFSQQWMLQKVFSCRIFWSHDSASLSYFIITTDYPWARFNTRYRRKHKGSHSILPRHKHTPHSIGLKTFKCEILLRRLLLLLRAWLKSFAFQFRSSKQHQEILTVRATM